MSCSLVGSEMCIRDRLWSVFLSTSSPILMMYLVCSVHSKGKGRPRGLPPINGGVASTTTGNKASESTLFNKPVQLWLSFTNCQKKEVPSDLPITTHHPLFGGSTQCSLVSFPVATSVHRSLTKEKKYRYSHSAGLSLVFVAVRLGMSSIKC